MKNYRIESMARINTLNPKLIPTATKVIDAAWKDRIHVYVVWAYRSSHDQDLLYRFGRDIPGQIQTTKRGGWSAHNYGLALDFCLMEDDKMLLWEDVQEREYWKQKWVRLVRMFEAEGWETGWRWPSFEPGHVQNLLGKSMGEIYQIYEQENENRSYGIETIRKQTEDQGIFI